MFVLCLCMYQAGDESDDGISRAPAGLYEPLPKWMKTIDLNPEA